MASGLKAYSSMGECKSIGLVVSQGDFGLSCFAQSANLFGVYLLSYGCASSKLMGISVSGLCVVPCVNVMIMGLA